MAVIVTHRSQSCRVTTEADVAGTRRNSNAGAGRHVEATSDVLVTLFQRRATNFAVTGQGRKPRRGGGASGNHSRGRQSYTVTEPVTDEDLMLAVRAGDSSRPGATLRPASPPLFDYLARMTGNRSVAEDLVQDVFVRILKYRHTFREDSRFDTWVFRIARNVRADISAAPDAGKRRWTRRRTVRRQRPRNHGRASSSIDRRRACAGRCSCCATTSAS